MDFFLVLDLGISVAQNVDCDQSAKVQRAFNFAETFIKNVDKKEVAVHLIYLIGAPVLAKNNIDDPALVRPLFKSALKPKDNAITFAASQYNLLCDIIRDNKRSYNFEVLIVTDQSEEIPFPDELKLPCLLRFVLLTDFNDDEILSEHLVATLECVSLNCAVEANFVASVTELDPKMHFPMLIGDYANEVELATMLSKEKRTVKDVTIIMSPNVNLKATLSPGLPKRLVVIEEEMLSRRIVSEQPPTFRFVGAASMANLVRMNTTSLAFEVCPSNSEIQANVDSFHKLYEALVDTKTVAILLHSSGEECYLRPLKFSGAGNDCTLIMQFYATQYVDWQTNNDLKEPAPPAHQFSYKTSQLYWNEIPDVYTDINKMCRKLKKDANPKPFYDDMLIICEFAVACGFGEFAQEFAHLLEKRSQMQDLGTNQHLLKVLGWLRSPDGFSFAASELTKVIKILGQSG